MFYFDDDDYGYNDYGLLEGLPLEDMSTSESSGFLACFEIHNGIIVHVYPEDYTCDIFFRLDKYKPFKINDYKTKHLVPMLRKLSNNCKERYRLLYELKLLEFYEHY